MTESMVRKSIFFPSALWKKCEEEAKKTDISASELIRKILQFTMDAMEVDSYNNPVDDNPTKRPNPIHVEKR